jgi:hypothetical protein
MIKAALRRPVANESAFRESRNTTLNLDALFDRDIVQEQELVTLAR